MNYIKQLNQFHDIKTLNPLSSNAQCLYLNLLHINNKCNWITEFVVSNTMLIALTGIDRRTLDRTRNELIQKGYIEYKKGIGNQAGKYLIVQFDTQCDIQNDIQYDIQNGIQMSYNVSTLNKHKHKQNNIKEKNIKKRKDNLSSKDLENEFNEVWNLYPRKQGRSNALKKYLSARKNGVSQEVIVNGIKAYLFYIETKEIEPQFIKQGSTWFNQECWKDEYRQEQEQEKLTDLVNTKERGRVFRQEAKLYNLTIIGR